MQKAAAMTSDNSNYSLGRTSGRDHYARLGDDAGIDGAGEARWRQWQRKSREDDARFRRQVRTVALDAAAAAALGGALWLTFR
jgi:hypothetical protein